MTTIGVAMHRTGMTRVRTRLTRRGRVVLAALVVLPALVVGGVVAANNAAEAGTNSSYSASFRHITVQPGDSLWSIARRISPASDPRDVIGAIIDLNGLSSSVVQAGQRLAIPHQYDSTSH
ncbi:hypothetical protein GCM10027568_04500 [Humibacter soli]